MITCSFENENAAHLRHVTCGCLVLRDGQLLLGKRAEGLLEAGKWGLLGGFVDRDETVAQAVAREVMEESGWTIDDIRLFRINDNPLRPHEDRQNIDFLFTAHALEKIGTSDWETQALQWFSLDALPAADEVAFDHFDTIRLYREYLSTPFPLPVYQVSE